MKTRSAPLLWVSFAMIVGVTGAALISPLYALYKTEWQLQASDISLTYVIYMLGALFSLLVLGRLPDRLGAYKLLVLSLLLSIMGSAITLFAETKAMLFLGRFIVGLASSLTTSAGTVALNQHLPQSQRHRGSLIFSLVVAAGFGAGPLVGGATGQYIANPLQMAYIPPILLCLVALVGMHLFVRGKGDPVEQKPVRLGDFIPKMTLPARGQRLHFLLSCGSAFLAFSAFGLYASMVPLFINDMMHLKGPLVSGVSIAAILFSSCIAQLSLQRIAAFRAVRLGLITLAISSLCLMVNLTLNSAPLFIIGVLFVAISHGMSIMGSMALVARVSTPENRSGLSATFMVMGYLGAVISVLGLGWLADHLSLILAVESFCAVMIALSLLLLVANAVTRNGRTSVG